MQTYAERSRRLLPASLSAALILAAIPAMAQSSGTSNTQPASGSGSDAAAPAVTAQKPTPTAKSTTEDMGDTIIMSPFVVDSTKDKGYFAQNTLSGSRLNTNVGDLASSITVVTKEQLNDTGALGVNDVFMYEANTEGANTYTPVITDRGAPKDTLSGYMLGNNGTSYGTAVGNRVRGLGVADMSQDNYPSIARIPFDTYNTQSVEINRGPNSMLFGTGSPAGIANQTRADAVLDQKNAQLQLRGGNYGAFRESVTLNTPLIANHLALYAAQVYDSKGFERKPSYDYARRQYATLTYEPFTNHKVRITASFEHYNANINDPNTLTPRDLVTPWYIDKRPVYNPITRMATFLDNSSSVLGPYVLSTTDPGYIPGTTANNAALTATTSLQYIPAMTYWANHALFFIDQGSPLYAFQAQQSIGAPSTRTLAQQLAYEIRLTESTNYVAPTGYAAWTIPAVTNKGIYDWTKINVNSLNYTKRDARIYNIDYQQVDLLPGLNAEVGWFRQELHELDNDPMSQTNPITLTVDTNQYLPNGQPNQYLGAPFVNDSTPDTYINNEINNNWRVMLNYSIDPTGKLPNWLSWIGKQQIVGLFTQQDDIKTDYRLRYSQDGGDGRYLPNPFSSTTPSNWSYAKSAGTYRVYYLSDGNTNGVVTHSPGYWGSPGYGAPHTQQITTYNYATGQYETTSLNFDSLLDFDGNGGYKQEVLTDALSGAYQGRFWNDRILPTLGWRKDSVKIRSSNDQTLATYQLYTNGVANWGLENNETPWTYYSGYTKTLGGVVRPFQHWSYIDSAANQGNILADFIRGIRLHINTSDNFNPPTAVQTDFFGGILPKPQGTGKDWGYGVSLFQNKLNIDFNFFESNNQNTPGAAPTSVTRILYIDETELKDWSTFVVRIRHGENQGTNFNNNTSNPLSVAEQNEISTLMGLPFNWPSVSPSGGATYAPTATQTTAAHGMEVQATYNVTPNWRIKATVGRAVTINSQIAPELQKWIAYRYPTWTSLTAPDVASVTQVPTSGSATNVNLGSFWNGGGYDSNVSLSGSNPTTAMYYGSAFLPVYNTDMASSGTIVANQRQWTGTLMSAYDFRAGRLRGLGVGGDIRWASDATAGYYGSTTNLNSSGQIAAPDLSRPIYTPATLYLDLFTYYNFKLPKFGTDVKVQLNMTGWNMLKSANSLLPISYNLDGSPAYYRIIDPPSYYITATFGF